MKKMFVFLAALAFLTVSCENLFAQQNAATGTAATKETAQKPKEAAAKTEAVKTAAGKEAAPAAEIKEPSKEEMVARLKEMVEYHPDLLSAVPGLAVKEADGKKYVEYNGKRLEDLDKETLLNVYRAANRFISFKNMQRFQQQQKNLKQIQDLNRMQKQIKQTQTTTPRIPKTYTPPKTYRSPGK